ncbi:hypothetical protein CQ018_18650 [Arthrobacter sp. MYb227]|uniref:DUF1684 domain-containing protein n=1 Tax=Arthrobacter sp. MYb227 TaxID=1848601 RepID=UPI000CFAD0C9|nr:DUF1684 domain-containing protein [Arthrobacter sp. MYb227]PQZ86700.1 hypothetical protein CQ018_18650 [Arthrobacter sp. MYb227]
MREEGLAVEFGSLTLSSFQWIPTIPSLRELVPGWWSADAYGAHTVFVTQDAITDPDGEPLSGNLNKALDEGDLIHFVRKVDVLVELGMRDGRYMIRTRNRNHERLRNFFGVPIFEHAPALKVSGRFTAYDSPWVVPIGNFREDTKITAELVGDVEFEFGGISHRLAVTQQDDGSLALTFGDESNGLSTVSCRCVKVPAPGPGGQPHH